MFRQVPKMRERRTMRFDVTPDVLLDTRFALSPMAELLGSLLDNQHLVESGGRGSAGFETWIDRAPLHRDLVSLLAHTKWLPDFVGLTPPRDQDATFEEELALIARWDEEAFSRTLADAHARAWIPLDTGWFRTPCLPGLTADALHTAWDLIVAPDWSRRLSVLRREIAFRTSLIARHGWARAVSDMGRRVAWDSASMLTISLGTEESVPAGSHLRFVPTTHRQGVWTCDGPDGVALVYPARGARAPGRADPDGHLAALLGTGRAALLLALDTPATPSQLHAQLGYALGTIGGHLKILHRNALVERVRLRQEVYYSRSGLGDELVRERQ